ncbi:signal transduction histidine kinase [Loktanella sp. PT4BL]|nr:signal transduction histidine kinase [Loktanella sp. PT4BL]
MTRRPIIRWRVGVIFVIGLLAMLSIPVALFYALNDAEPKTGLPQPRQLAAIVRLLEVTPIDERQAVVEALQSSEMSVRVAPDAQLQTDLAPLWPDEPERTASYRAMLDGRAFAAYAVPRNLFNQSRGGLLTAVEFRVVLNDGGVLIVASESAMMFTERGVPLGFPTAFLGALIAFVALLLLNREFRSVQRLARAVEAIDPADPHAALPEIRARTAEVRLLIEVFRRQQAQVASLLKARSAMIGGIQHDVRTFATRLRLRIEKLSNPEDRRQAETDIADLVSLMDGALIATRGEAGSLDLELIDFSDLVCGEVKDRRASGRDIDLTVETMPTGFDILGDRVALRRVLSNLVENALRYGTSAHVSLTAEAGIVKICIDDDGPGIPAAKRDELMQPFSRLEVSRSRETGGAGLGLAIVQTLVAAHDGNVSIGDAPKGGARITVTLPRFTPSTRAQD